MKFNSIEYNKTALSLILLAVRIFAGLAMISHGFPKLQQLLSNEPVEFYNFLGIGPVATIILTIFAELVCSMFLILGLFTRFFTFFLVFTMAVAAFMVHGQDTFSEKELSLMYLAIYLIIFILGAGRYSVDALLSKKRSRY